MRKEYNIKKLKVKRRGMMPAFQTDEASANKIRITISLDKDIIDYFKSEAKHPGAFPYQTQINQALRKIIIRWKNEEPEDFISVKEELLNDEDFLHKLAKKIDHK